MSSENNSNNDVNDKSQKEFSNDGHAFDGIGFPEYKKPSWRSTWGFGPVTIGPRIAPVLPHLRDTEIVASDSEGGSDILNKQIQAEEGSAIKYRSCSWQKVVHPQTSYSSNDS